MKTLLRLLAAALALQLASAYSCPTTCTPPACQCATNKSPLPPADTPQFIILSNDDAISVTSQPIIMNITERHTNPNGCKIPATWFVTVDDTEVERVKQVYARGHELAARTMSVPSEEVDIGAEDIVGVRTWLNEKAGIPLDKVVGFRAPKLQFSPRQRSILAANGFLYDSSISEKYPSAMSPTAGSMLWPYTMDAGIPQDCAVSTGTCAPGEKQPGLWEVPIWMTQRPDSTAVAAVNPAATKGADLFALYKNMFDARYSGNRAPMGVFNSASSLGENRAAMDQINKFLAYALSKDNVWVVTPSQVIDWMKNPVKASAFNAPCPDQPDLLKRMPNAGNQLCAIPSAGCSYGDYNPDRCRCVCQNEAINEAGYCLDARRRCTIQKTYDFAATQYVCPAQKPAASAAADPMPAGRQRFTFSMEVFGLVPGDAAKAKGVCDALLRTVSQTDSSAKCKVVSVAAPSTPMRRLLEEPSKARSKVTVTLSTNDPAAVKAVLSEPVVLSSQMAPSAMAVVPSTFKIEAMEPAPANEGDPVPAPTPAPESSSSSSMGAIIGGVVGGICAVAVGVVGFMWVRRRRAAKAAVAQPDDRISSFNPAYDAAVTAKVTLSNQNVKAGLESSTLAASASPLRDSMKAAPF